MLGWGPLRRRSMHLAATLGCLGVLAAACGHRLSEQEIVAKNTVGASASPANAAGVASVDGAAVAPTEIATGEDGSGSGGGGSDVASAGASDAGGTAAGAAGGSDADAQAGSATPGQAAASTEKKPIRVGFIGALSGAAGVNVGPRRDGWVVWAKMINAKGGINGHRIELLVGDDGTNDARGVAIARDFVENKGAVALSWSSNDISGLAEYVKKKRVPIIGIVEGQEVWGTNPMLFPMSTGAAGGWGTIRAAKKAQVTKIAILYCVEAQTCETAAAGMADEAPSEGVQVVYRAGVSITQPDFTAECIQARNSGAQGIVMLVDENSTIRFMQSCLRQGYKPVAIAGGTDGMAKLPEMDGMVSGTGTFPWFLRSGAPGLEEYTQALQKYAPKMLTEGTSAQTTGWVAAKIFERAVENATKTSNPDQLTSADILNGLWAMKGETLGGLAQGGLARSYRREQPNPSVNCTFVSRLQRGTWTSLTGIVPECR